MAETPKHEPTERRDGAPAKLVIARGRYVVQDKGEARDIGRDHGEELLVDVEQRLEGDRRGPPLAAVVEDDGDDRGDALRLRVLLLPRLPDLDLVAEEPKRHERLG